MNIMNIISLEKSIENLNEKSINNFVPVHSTYLNWAVKENNMNVMNTLLKKGINPNGITSIGLSKNIPLTVIDFSSDNFQTIVRMLLKNGSNINGDDLGGHSVLTKCVEYFLQNKKYTNPLYFELFTFLLERGSNSDGTIFFNPLHMIVSSFLLHPVEEIDVRYNLCELLIAYNANPKYNVITFHKAHLNSRYTAVGTLLKLEKYREEYRVLNKLFNISIDQVVNDCESDIILESLSKYFKIPYDNSRQSRKKICDCVKNISKNKNKYDEETFVSIRKKIRTFKKSKECSNEDLLIGVSPDSFPESELIYLDESNPNLRYCFHVSEIPMLLSFRKNPFNNNPLPEEFLEDLVTKYKYFVPKTLEETLNDLFIFKEIEINSDTLIDKLTDYIKTFNPYIQPDKIKTVGVLDMMEITNMIYQGNQILINANTLPSDRLVIIGEVFNGEPMKKRILERTLTHIFLYLKNNNGSLPLISNIIDQGLRDTFTARDIMSLFVIQKEEVKMLSRTTDSYNNFIDEIGRIFLRKAGTIYSVYKPFFNSLSSDDKANINKMKPGDIMKLFKKYISSNIEVLLKTRFGEISLNDAWNDIIPSLLRVL